MPYLHGVAKGIPFVGGWKRRRADCWLVRHAHAHPPFTVKQPPRCARGSGQPGCAGRKRCCMCGHRVIAVGSLRRS